METKDLAPANEKRVDRAGLELRELRLKLGWSQSQMCRRLGCTQEIIGRFESGELAPDPETLVQYESLFSIVELQSRRHQIRPIADSVLQAESLQQISEDSLDH